VLLAQVYPRIGLDHQQVRGAGESLVRGAAPDGGGDLDGDAIQVERGPRLLGTSALAEGLATVELAQSWPAATAASALPLRAQRPGMTAIALLSSGKQRQRWLLDLATALDTTFLLRTPPPGPSHGAVVDPVSVLLPGRRQLFVK
jgi:hypothetical protein